MTSEAFRELVNEQVGHEFSAEQQYIAIAVWYDGQTLPELAAFFYRQALEERGHALMMVGYLLDQDAGPLIPAVEAPKNEFADIAEPVRLALDQEKRVTEQIHRMAGVAREQGDYAGEQFIQWFIKEQVEEVSSMGDLLTLVERSIEAPLEIEEYLARQPAGEGADPTAPSPAGGPVA